MGIFKQTFAQLQAFFDKHEKVLTTDDVINSSDSDETNKPVSAAQLKAVKGTIPGTATTSKAGTVKQLANIAEATNAEDIIAQFNALLVEMRAKGTMANS